MNILAITGSLRSASKNTQLLRALAALDPSITLYEKIGELPHFNSDVDDAGAPQPVLDYREQLRAAGLVVISSPEYAHGVPGVMKNALDWVVGSGELIDKPIVLINTSAASKFVIPQLAETLTVMSAKVVKTCTIWPLVETELRALIEQIHAEMTARSV
ncbi:MAG TPA: NADPH-dependent FMN reductase [Thermoanaerobaculia bacterium]|nr:NADPH-dependent FMN reductase [Thermoanaerobaculia bacterium]